MMREWKIGIICATLTVLALQVGGGAGTGLLDARAQTPNRAGLVVRFGDGSFITHCVEFSEPQISGYDVLMRSGLNVVAAFDSGQGAAVCAIEGTGCPVESCLTCDTPNYWSYWHYVNGAWTYSAVGAIGHTVYSGDVEGWSWGAGDSPPEVPFHQICGAPPPTDTPVPPTNTPLPPTDTPVPPTDTPLPPTDTPVPPTDTPSPGAAATSPPLSPEAWFRVDANPIPAGTCITLRWNTSNAVEIYLDGERVGADGSRDVCLSASQEYKLRVVGAADEQTYNLVLGVSGDTSAASLAPPPTAIPPALPSSTSQPVVEASQPSTATPQDEMALAPTSSHTPQPTNAAQPSSTPVQAAELLPTPSPYPTSRPMVTSADPAASGLQPANGDQETVSRDQGSISPLVPIGYIAFSLVAGGLLGWLVFIMTRRK
jgi:hypothetical protein